MKAQEFKSLLKTLKKPTKPVTIDIRNPAAEVPEVTRGRGRPRKDPSAPKVVSEETRAKLSAALKGRQFSEETRKKMSESRKGRAPGNKGTKHTDEGKPPTNPS